MGRKCNKICVTGGAGFIGSHLVDRLLADRYDVLVIDDLSNGKLTNLPKEGSFRFAKCDIRDSKTVRRLLKGVDAIFHEAALTSVEASLKTPQLVNEVNVGGTLNLLKAAIDCGVKRFIYASSVAVCGDVPPPQSENGPTRPISPYGVSKLAAENYVRVFCEIYGLETIGLRYFNVYGPRQSGDSIYSGVIVRFINRLINNKKLTIYGDGEQTRDFVHVSDVVEANMIALEKRDAVGKVLNVGTGRSTSVNEVAEILLKSFGKSSKSAVHVEPRDGDIRFSCADARMSKDVLGFTSRLRLEDELPRLVDLYRNS